jgi:hypothetical protein
VVAFRHDLSDTAGLTQRAYCNGPDTMGP